MRIYVLTRDAKTREAVSLRQIDDALPDARKWLGGHSVWAWHHGRTVETFPADENAEALLATMPHLPRDERRDTPPAAGVSTVKSGGGVAGQVVTVSIDQAAVRSKDDIRRELEFREARFHGLQRRR